MGQPTQKRLLAPFGVMAAFHREQLPLDGVMGLIWICRNFHLMQFGVCSLPVNYRAKRGSAMMTVSFKGAHFPKEIMLMGVRWYLAYPLSTRHVEALSAT
jgi:hypothetical protein